MSLYVHVFSCIFDALNQGIVIMDVHFLRRRRNSSEMVWLATVSLPLQQPSKDKVVASDPVRSH